MRSRSTHVGAHAHATARMRSSPRLWLATRRAAALAARHVRMRDVARAVTRVSRVRAAVPSFRTRFNAQTIFLVNFQLHLVALQHKLYDKKLSDAPH